MQINSSPRFLKNFTIGLIASSVGTVIALPSVAMPATDESVAAPEAVEETTVESAGLLERLLEGIPTSSAAGTLLTPEATAEVDAPEADAFEASEEDVSETTETEETLVEEPAESGTATVETNTLNDGLVEETDEDIDGDIDALTEDTEAGVDALDEDIDDSTDAVGEDTEADAEMTDESVEADAETTDESAEADAEMTDETSVEADTDEDAEAEADDVAEEINTEELTITELTQSNDSFTILAAALEAADLTEVLSEAGPYTVFAPTDEAFEALPVGTVEQLLLPENKEVLIQVLTYHVVPGAVLSTDLEPGNVATLAGSNVTVEVGDTVTVNNANVLVADVQASNGVIHIIDRVLVPSEPEADTEAGSPEPIQ